LTIYVEPIDNFDLAMVAPLHQRWSEKFPALGQAFPRRRPDELPDVDIVGFANGWPTPAVEQVDTSLSRTLSYQRDQISLEWKFDSEAADTTYPGFASLSAELSSVFAYFLEVVERLGDKTLRIQGARCAYMNLLDGIEGVDWMAGYISGWQGSALGSQLGDAEYFGLRVKKTSENPDLATSRIAMSELDSGQEVGGTLLRIDVVSVPQSESSLSDLPPAEAARAMLEDAHAALIATFEDSADDGMRAKWGVRQ
jgi:hypothetical protein